MNTKYDKFKMFGESRLEQSPVSTKTTRIRGVTSLNRILFLNDHNSYGGRLGRDKTEEIRIVLFVE